MVDSMSEREEKGEIFRSGRVKAEVKRGRKEKEEERELTRVPSDPVH